MMHGTYKFNGKIRNGFLSEDEKNRGGKVWGWK